MKVILNQNRETLMKITILLFFVFFSFSHCQAQVATISISNINTTVMDNTPLLFGITFDARTSLIANGSLGQIGYYNANGNVIPAVDAIFNDFPMSTLRYPGNGIATGFDWKKSIGMIGTRPNQNLLGTQGSPQPVNFGFDEFMAMTAAKGVTPDNIQIMVPIYDPTTSGLTTTQANAAVANVISNNADWVEYCNALNNGSNPGGGTDWAAQRAANGHPTPYGIKIWNIGNEPWSDLEFGPTAVDCNDYLTAVTPIINAMLAIDPTIKITLPTTGYPNNSANWSYALLNSTLVVQGKVYALSQHYFPSETTTAGIAPVKGVSAVNSGLNTLITAAATKGVKIFIGDYAHYIVSPNPTTAQKDSAMQWVAANFEADFLLMLSQKSTIERANFWVYGNTQATWHPIRYNSLNNYTLMPAAEIYKILFPAFLDKSISATSTSPVASDLNPYAVRSNAFVSNDLVKLNIVSVNRDKTNTIPLQINGVVGYSLLHARLLTAISLTAETIIESIATTDVSGNYLMPPMSVLIVEYTNNAIGISETISNEQSNNIYPNPASENISFMEMQNEIEIYNSIGQIIIPKMRNVKTIVIEHFIDGIYFIKTDKQSFIFIVKH